MPAEVVYDAPYPARTKTAKGTIGGTPAEVEVTYFRDKILVLVSQGGRLAQWIQVPLSAPSAASVDAALPAGLRAGGGGASASLLPSTHLTPRTLFGAGGEARETFGQLVAAQIGSLLALRDASDARTLLVGLGLDLDPRAVAPTPGATAGAERRADCDSSADGADGHALGQVAYYDVVDLVQKAL